MAFSHHKRSMRNRLMNIICENCRSKFTVDANRIPPGKTASFQCPRCGNKVLIRPPSPPAVSSEPPPSGKMPPAMPDTVDNGLPNEYPADIDFYDGKTALICENDSALATQIHQILEEMQYRPHSCGTIRDAIKKMRFHQYDLVILDESFDTRSPGKNGVQIYIEQLDTSRRRDIFVVLISRQFQTMNRMNAFNKSVNLIVNPAHISELRKILEKAIEQNEAFYNLFKEILQNRGIRK